MLTRRDEGAEREATAERLGKQENVGAHRLVFQGEHLAGTAQSGDYLVEYE